MFDFDAGKLIVIGVVAVLTASSVLGQEPAAQASTAQVLEYGTR